MYRGKALKPAIPFSLMIYSGRNSYCQYDRRSPVHFLTNIPSGSAERLFKLCEISPLFCVNRERHFTLSQERLAGPFETPEMDPPFARQLVTKKIYPNFRAIGRLTAKALCLLCEHGCSFSIFPRWLSREG